MEAYTVTLETQPAQSDLAIINHWITIQIHIHTISSVNRSPASKPSQSTPNQILLTTRHAKTACRIIVYKDGA